MAWWADVERALCDVPHAIVGAVAANAYAPPRATADIDCAIATADVYRAEAALRGARWEKGGDLGLVLGTSWRDSAGHELDLIALDTPWAEPAIMAARVNQVEGLPTMPLPYLVLMKLLASRTIDLSDISRMMGRATQQQIAEVRQIVARYGDQQDLEDFDQLVRMGQLERSITGEPRQPPPAE